MGYDICRGMVILDKNGDNGLKLVIEDYLFVIDGFEFWGVINEWLCEYVDFIYLDDGEVEEDREF